MRQSNRKRLTTQSHFKASIILYEIQKGNIPEHITWDIPKEHIRMLELFVIEGKTAVEISDLKFLVTKRKTFMGPDMVMIWLHRYLPEIEYEMGKFHCKRAKNVEEQREFARLKKLIPKTPCVMCGSNEHLELDHIKPCFYGGKTELSNLQWLCYDCHKEKTAREFAWL